MWLMNPFLLLLFGTDWWLERMARLRPYRWWTAFLAASCTFSISIYAIRYT
jgi:hypothetical protein